MEDIRGKVPIKNTQCMPEHKDVLNDLGILHIPDIDDNETNDILSVVDENFLDLQQEVALAKPGWLDIDDDELMDMTAIFQGYMTDSQILMQIIPFDYLPTTKDDITIQILAYKYVNKILVDQLQKVHVNWLYRDISSMLSNVKYFAWNELIAMLTKEQHGMNLQVGLNS
eukprot:14181153-Ditylum_brightwellii.AAC.1